MENKGYADFGGQTRCIMGNVEMVNITNRAFLAHFGAKFGDGLYLVS